MEDNKQKHCTTVGGQALIEGLMMIGPKNVAIAVRKPDGEIVTKNKPPFSKGFFSKVPIIRGSVLLFKQLMLGMSALMFSAEFVDIEEAEKQRNAEDKSNIEEETPSDSSKKSSETVHETEDEKETEKPSFLERIFGERLKTVVIVFAVIISIFMSIGLFILLPNLIATISMLPFDAEARANFSFEHIKTTITGTNIFLHPIEFANSIPSMFGIKNTPASNSLFSLSWQNILYNFFEGIVRIVIFFLYIVLAAKLSPDIKRVWQYHGAEHKTIHAYENGDELTVENIKKYPTMHPRCGTSFLFTVMIVSIIVFSVIKWQNIVFNISVRILLVPLAAGISYELFKIAGKSQSKLWSFFKAPGLMFQRFTTAEPDDKMIEVAIVAMNNALTENKEDDKW